MSFSTTYLLHVALHAVVLSVFASFVLMALRQARHRSVAAIAGLLAVGFLPWLTALRPMQSAPVPVPEIQPQETPALPIWTVAILPAQQKPTPAPAEPTAVPAKPVFPDPPTTFVNLWAIGSGTGLLLLAIASLQVRTWRKSLLQMDDTAWRILQSLSREIPARGHFHICESAASPCVTGFRRPKIVIPRFLLENGSGEGLRWAVRHEVAHWQAGDSRWMILFALIRSVNWWNPLVHKLVSQWSDAREQLCDLQATGVSDSRADYGKFLIAMAGRITKQPPLAVAMAKRLHATRLKRRIVSLLAAKTGSESPVGRGFVGAGSAVFIGCAVLVSILKIGAEEPVIDTGIAVESEAAEKEFPAEPNSVPQAPEDPLASLIEKPQPPAIEGMAVRQVKFSTKFVMTATRPATKDGAVLTDAGIQFLLRTLSQTKGVDLMTAPSVTAKFGQTATVEIIWEVPGTPEQIAARGPKSPTPFTGIHLEISADLMDDQVNLKFDPEYHFIPGLDLSLVHTGNKPPAGTDPDTIKIAKRAVTARLTAAQTLCTDLGEIEPGKFLQVFIAVEPIDATGRPLDSFKNGKRLPDDNNRNVSEPTPGRRISDGRALPPDALPSSQVKGKLRLDAVLVEIPLKTPRPPGEGLVIGLTPSDSKVAAKIKNDPRAKVRKLKTVEMPLNEKGTPWPEFPGLNVSAIASKNFDLINISGYAVGDEPGQFPNIWEEMPSGSTMNFGIKTADTTIERRLLIKIEAVK